MLSTVSYQWQRGAGPVAPGRIFCIGKNFRKHIEELGDEAPGEPVVFMKPAACLVPAGEPIRLPEHGRQLHHEAELVVVIGKAGHHLNPENALSHVAGITLGLDLTLRDVQSRLKKKGLPWELSKSFEGSAPIGALTPLDAATGLESLEFVCRVNGKLRQRGRVSEMIHSIPEILAFLSGVWHLAPGDCIYTGTPAGVGPLVSRDAIALDSDWTGSFEWQVT